MRPSLARHPYPHPTLRHPGRRHHLKRHDRHHGLPCHADGGRVWALWSHIHLCRPLVQCAFRGVTRTPDGSCVWLTVVYPWLRSSADQLTDKQKLVLLTKGWVISVASCGQQRWLTVALCADTKSFVVRSEQLTHRWRSSRYMATGGAWPLAHVCSSPRVSMAALLQMLVRHLRSRGGNTGGGSGLPASGRSSSPASGRPESRQARSASGASTASGASAQLDPAVLRFG